MRENQVTNSVYRRPEITVLCVATESLILAGSPGSGTHNPRQGGGTVPHGAKAEAFDPDGEEESNLWND